MDENWLLFVVFGCFLCFVVLWCGVSGFGFLVVLLGFVVEMTFLVCVVVKFLDFWKRGMGVFAVLVGSVFG